MQIASSPPRLKQAALLEPLEREEEVVSHYRNSYHVQSQAQDVSSSDSDTDSVFESDSDSTPSPPLISIDARSDGVATVDSDGAESLYQSVNEENSPNDQVCSFNSTHLGY